MNPRTGSGPSPYRAAGRHRNADQASGISRQCTVRRRRPLPCITYGNGYYLSPAGGENPVRRPCTARISGSSICAGLRRSSDARRCIDAVLPCQAGAGGRRMPGHGLPIRSADVPACREGLDGDRPLLKRVLLPMIQFHPARPRRHRDAAAQGDHSGGRPRAARRPGACRLASRRGLSRAQSWHSGPQLSSVPGRGTYNKAGTRLPRSGTMPARLAFIEAIAGPVSRRARADR